MQKTLDIKLARIAADPSCGDFILADAKDADMAFGISAFGSKYNEAGERVGYRNAQEFRDQIREIVAQKLVDILLMSVSTSDVVTVRERLFDHSPVTPAIRANDTTDIWLAGGKASYGNHPSMPFRTALLDEAAEGGPIRQLELKELPVNLGLYSITLNNDAVLDRATLQAYRDFRKEAGSGFRHFLEVFAPNAPGSKIDDVPRYVNDSIARLLAGIGSRTADGHAKPADAVRAYHGDLERLRIKPQRTLTEDLQHSANA
jgi:hypothetical protein